METIVEYEELSKPGWIALCDLKEIYLREIMEKGVIVGYDIASAADPQFPRCQYKFVNVDV